MAWNSRHSIDIMVFGNVVPIGLQSYGHLCVDTVCLFNEVYLLRERLKSKADKVHIKLIAKVQRMVRIHDYDTLNWCRLPCNLQNTPASAAHNGR